MGGETNHHCMHSDASYNQGTTQVPCSQGTTPVSYNQGSCSNSPYNQATSVSYNQGASQASYGQGFYETNDGNMQNSSGVVGRTKNSFKQHSDANSCKGDHKFGHSFHDQTLANNLAGSHRPNVSSRGGSFSSGSKGQCGGSFQKHCSDSADQCSAVHRYATTKLHQLSPPLQSPQQFADVVETVNVSSSKAPGGSRSQEATERLCKNNQTVTSYPSSHLTFAQTGGASGGPPPCVTFSTNFGAPSFITGSGAPSCAPLGTSCAPVSAPYATLGRFNSQNNSSLGGKTRHRSSTSDLSVKKISFRDRRKDESEL